MTNRLRLLVLLAWLAVMAALVWILSSAMPTFWCSVLGTCNM